MTGDGDVLPTWIPAGKSGIEQQMVENRNERVEACSELRFVEYNQEEVSGRMCASWSSG